MRMDPSLAAMTGLTSRARRMTVGRSSRESTWIDEVVSSLACADAAAAGARIERTVNTPAQRARRAARRTTAMSVDIGVGKRGKRSSDVPINNNGTQKVLERLIFSCSLPSRRHTWRAGGMRMTRISERIQPCGGWPLSKEGRCYLVLKGAHRCAGCHHQYLLPGATSAGTLGLANEQPRRRLSSFVAVDAPGAW